VLYSLGMQGLGDAQHDVSSQHDIDIITYTVFCFQQVFIRIMAQELELEAYITNGKRIKEFTFNFSK
jgi:hypothetical protein